MADRGGSARPNATMRAFQEAHEHQYGLHIAERDPSSKAVTSVACRFCMCFGREAGVADRKRKRTQNVHYFRHPFKTDRYVSHMSGQHPHRWEEYNKLSKEGKASYFEEKLPRSQTIKGHFAEGTDHLFYEVEKDIVEIVMAQILVDDDAEEDLPRVLRSLFQPVTGEADEEVVAYKVTVKDTLMFQLAYGYVALGSSFRCANKLILYTKEKAHLSSLSGASEGKISKYARVCAAANYQVISEVLRSKVGFSIALDTATVATTRYFDTRIRFYLQGELHDFHLFAFPFNSAHTGEEMYALLHKGMNVLYKDWLESLVGVTTDGARNMTGRNLGIVSRLARAGRQASGSPVFRVWCGCHQLDLCVQEIITAYVDDAFYDKLTSLIGYLRRQQGLINAMNSKCPWIASTRWLSLGGVVAWLLTHKGTVRAHLASKKAACAPDAAWWISLHVIEPATKRLSILFRQLQGSLLTVNKQRVLMRAFVDDLCELAEIKKKVDGVDVDATMNTIVGDFYMSDGGEGAEEDNRLNFIHSQATSCTEQFNTIPTGDTVPILDALAHFYLSLADKVSKIEPVRDEHGDAPAELDIVPPTTPLELLETNTAKFVGMVSKQSARIQKMFGRDAPDQISSDLKELKRKYPEGKREELVAASKGSFDACWAPVRKRHRMLFKFATNMLTIYPTTARVEGDFSVMGFEKNEYRSSMMNITLESIMHCKQFEKLQKLKAIDL